MEIIRIGSSERRIYNRIASPGSEKAEAMRTLGELTESKLNARRYQIKRPEFLPRDPSGVKAELATLEGCIGSIDSLLNTFTSRVNSILRGSVLEGSVFDISHPSGQARTSMGAARNVGAAATHAGFTLYIKSDIEAVKGKSLHKAWKFRVFKKYIWLIQRKALESNLPIILIPDVQKLPGKEKTVLSLTFLKASIFYTRPSEPSPLFTSNHNLIRDWRRLETWLCKVIWNKLCPDGQISTKHSDPKISVFLDGQTCVLDAPRFSEKIVLSSKEARAKNDISFSILSIYSEAFAQETREIIGNLSIEDLLKVKLGKIKPEDLKDDGRGVSNTRIFLEAVPLISEESLRKIFEFKKIPLSEMYSELKDLERTLKQYPLYRGLYNSLQLCGTQIHNLGFFSKVCADVIQSLIRRISIDKPEHLFPIFTE